MVEERVYTVPLRRAWLAPRNVRSEKATRTLREFIMKHMKTGINSIKITNEVNEKIWSRGIQKPPRKIRVRVEKDSEGVVTVYLAERS
ncbi:MAG: 50S ribosomal protein L31e [Candidatus Bathyarchaeota archaeon]|nr:50S ribosomal protein L31e [Candidatus Bathyarchaeota archaeon]